MYLLWAGDSESLICVVIAVEKKDAEEQLAEALPALERARKALERLNKEDVTEIRQFANPPQAVQYVCACVAYLKGYKQADWKTCRGMMSDTNFLQSLQNLDVDNIRDKEVGPCSRTSLVRTPGDRQNVFALSGIRINRVLTNEVLL